MTFVKPQALNLFRDNVRDLQDWCVPRSKRGCETQPRPSVNQHDAVLTLRPLGLFVCRWTLGVFPCLSYGDLCFTKYGGCSTSLISCLISFDYTVRSGPAGSCGGFLQIFPESGNGQVIFTCSLVDSFFMSSQGLYLSSCFIEVNCLISFNNP